MKSVSDILINLLDPLQAQRAMREMETLAKQKYYNVQSYYEKNILDDDISEEVEELFDSSKWEHFLPAEYHKLKSIANAQPIKQAS